MEGGGGGRIVYIMFLRTPLTALFVFGRKQQRLSLLIGLCECRGDANSFLSLYRFAFVHGEVPHTIRFMPESQGYAVCPGGFSVPASFNSDCIMETHRPLGHGDPPRRASCQTLSDKTDTARKPERYSVRDPGLVRCQVFKGTSTVV